MNEKRIRYLEIKNCTLTEQNGKPALLAPEDADTDRLKWNRFLQMPDGKWVHFLTKSEHQAIEEAGQDQSEIILIELKSAEASAKTAHILAGVSAVLLPASILTLCFGGMTGGWLVLALLFLAGALVAAIAAVSYDRNSRSADFMLLLSVATIISVLLLMFFISSVRSACSQCEEQCHHIPG